MKKCSHCGAEMEEDTIFCKCGWGSKNNTKEIDYNPQIKKIGNIKVILLLLCFFVGVLTIGSFISNDNEITNYVFLGISVLCFVIFIILNIISGNLKFKQKIMLKKKEEMLIERDKAEGWEIIELNKFSLNENKKMLKINNNEYKFKDIIGCEVLENETSIINTVSQKKVSLGKAVIGGALIGPAGAIIGGNAGKTNSKSTQSSTCSSLKIKINLNNLSNPCEFIEFLKFPVNKENHFYKEAFEKVQKIVSIIDIICKN